MRSCHLLAALGFLPACTDYFDVTNADPEPTEAIGHLVLSVSTQGGDLDLDGYRLAVDGKDFGVAIAHSSALVRAIVVGQHEVELLDVAGNCDVVDGAQRSVTVEKQASVRVSFQVVCYATGIEFITHTQGVDLDPDGYTVQVTDQPAQVLPVTGSRIISRMSPGTYDVAIDGLEEHCRLQGDAGFRVEVSDRQLIKVQLEFACLTTTGVLEVLTTITGDDEDLAGYRVTVASVGEQHQAPTQTTARFDRLAPGTYQATLGIAANCTVEGGPSRTAMVTVTSDYGQDTTRVAFAANCIRIRRIAYSRADTIFTAFADGTGAQVLTTGGMEPSWSADGRHLAFSRAECRQVYDEYYQQYYTVCDRHGISLFSAEDAVIRNVTTGEHWNPALSPDGTSIAYVAQAEGKLKVVSLTSGSTTTLDFPSLSERDPAWSPDGTRLAFTCYDPSTGDADICHSNADNSNLIRFRDGSGYDYGPAWSPGGTRIAFNTYRYGYPSIGVMAADGTGITRVAAGNFGRWAGNDSKLVFVTHDGNLLARVNADGSGLVILREKSHTAPAWRP
jgi:Tol biopolymer transport system component